MKKTNVAFLVEYLDDVNCKHITFVNSISELKFIEERYEKRVKYEPILKHEGTDYIGTFTY